MKNKQIVKWGMKNPQGAVIKKKQRILELNAAEPADLSLKLNQSI